MESNPAVIDHHLWFRATIDGQGCDIFIHVDAIAELIGTDGPSRAEMEQFARDNSARLLVSAQRAAARAIHVPSVIMIEHADQLQPIG